MSSSGCPLTVTYLRELGILSYDGASSAYASGPAAPESAAAPAPLRILTFNVLFPNSTPYVWWIYKYYLASDEDNESKPTEAISSWEYRRDRVKEIIRSADADVVCLQEAYCDRWGPKTLPKDTKDAEAESKQFYEDFSFMICELGYGGMAVLSKGAIRPATFWRTQGDARAIEDLGTSHQYRVLVKLLRVRSRSQGLDPGHLLAVVNCHLSGGPVPDKRVSSLQDGLKAAEKLMKAQGPPSQQLPYSVIVCGDFNTGEELSYLYHPDAERRKGGRPSGSPTDGCDIFLTACEVTPSVIEDGIPVCSKPKRHSFSPFIDCGKHSGPTMVVLELESKMRRTERLGGMKDDGQGNKVPMDSDHGQSFKEQVEEHLTTEFIDILRECFGKYSPNPEELTLTPSEIEQWQNDVNIIPGRGTGRVFFEQKRKDATTDPSSTSPPSQGQGSLYENITLSFYEFAYIYLDEVREGKFWSVEMDIRNMRGGKGVSHEACFRESNHYYAARYDKVYLSTNGPAKDVPASPKGTTSVNSVRILNSERANPSGYVLPNAWHPSDHLPVLVELDLP